MSRSSVVDRVVAAVNDHDIEAMVACMGADYRSEQPLHPEAGFGGSDQVAENWTALFAEIPTWCATSSLRANRGTTYGASGTSTATMRTGASSITVAW